jgi:threonine synthase
MKLVCTGCGKGYDLDGFYQRCQTCHEPLELELFEGKLSLSNLGYGSVWQRYVEFFSVFDSRLIGKLSMGEGNTPVVKAHKLSERLGSEIYLKNETLNPTWSFKDRGTLTGVLRAINLGFGKIGTVSTGNMAASVAAYGARAELKTFILVGADIPEEKIYPIVVYGSKLIEVDAYFGDIYKRSLEIGSKSGIYFINSDDPFRVEGYKTIGFEIAESFGMIKGAEGVTGVMSISGIEGTENVNPDYIIVPTGSGGLFRGIFKAFRELKKSGLIKKIPEFIVVQAEGCAPIVEAYESGKETVEKIDEPKTIAKAIADPSPPSGNEVLRKLRKYGRAISVTDKEILEAQRLLAKDGIFVQPASATGIAAIMKLRGEQDIRNSSFVSILTGSGLKFISAVEKILSMEREENKESITQSTGLKIPKVKLNELERFLASF